jgi:hypothetical protein
MMRTRLPACEAVVHQLETAVQILNILLQCRLDSAQNWKIHRIRKDDHLRPEVACVFYKEIRGDTR